MFYSNGFIRIIDILYGNMKGGITMENLFNVAMYYYKVKDVADLLLVNEETVRKWIKENRLSAIASGSKKNGYIRNIIMSRFLNSFVRLRLSDNHIGIR